MIQGRVRTTLTLTFDDEQKDLPVTFDLIDRVSSLVDWASIPERIGLKGHRPISEMAKLIFYVMQAAGFNPDIDDIYDDMRLDEESEEKGVLLAMQICKAFSPKGKKKDSQPAKKQATKRKRKTKT